VYKIISIDAKEMKHNTIGVCGNLYLSICCGNSNYAVQRNDYLAIGLSNRRSESGGTWLNFQMNLQVKPASAFTILDFPANSSMTTYI
jgi:hypothetical protein